MENSNTNKMNNRRMFVLLGLVILLLCVVIYFFTSLYGRDDTNTSEDSANSTEESLQIAENDSAEQNGSTTDIQTEAYLDETVNADTDMVTAGMQWDYSTKLPNEYTQEDYEALSEEQKDAFAAWFDSDEDYVKWESSVTESYTDLELPWMNGHKTPEYYTYEEFELLSGEQQDAFYDWFSSYEDFLEWEDNAGNAEPVGDYPWTCGGKKPDRYTYAEFETLSPELQNAFFEWFPTFEDYMRWEDNA